MKKIPVRSKIWKAIALACLPAVLGCEFGDSSSSDGISVSSVVWLDTDVSGWSQTATLEAAVSGETLILSYDKANSWPATASRATDGSTMNANCWVIANVGGTWYGATFDWMRTGQTTKPVSAVRGSGGHINYAPLNTFSPRSGEKYGFLVTTPARTGERTVNERSNISMVTWP